MRPARLGMVRSGLRAPSGSKTRSSGGYESSGRVLGGVVQRVRHIGCVLPSVFFTRRGKERAYFFSLAVLGAAFVAPNSSQDCSCGAGSCELWHRPLRLRERHSTSGCGTFLSWLIFDACASMVEGGGSLDRPGSQFFRMNLHTSDDVSHLPSDEITLWQSTTGMGCFLFFDLRSYARNSTPRMNLGGIMMRSERPRGLNSAIGVGWLRLLQPLC